MNSNKTELLDSSIAELLLIIINTLFEIGKKLHSSAKNLQSNLYQLKIIIVIK